MHASLQIQQAPEIEASSHQISKQAAPQQEASKQQTSTYTQHISKQAAEQAAIKKRARGPK
jgi:hypothetical protein